MAEEPIPTDEEEVNAKSPPSSKSISVRRNEPSRLLKKHSFETTIEKFLD